MALDGPWSKTTLQRSDGAIDEEKERVTGGQTGKVLDLEPYLETGVSLSTKTKGSGMGEVRTTTKERQMGKAVGNKK